MLPAPVFVLVLVPVPAPAAGVRILGPGAAVPPVVVGVVVVSGLIMAAGSGFAVTFGPGLLGWAGPCGPLALPPTACTTFLLAPTVARDGLTCGWLLTVAVFNAFGGSLTAAVAM